MKSYIVFIAMMFFSFHSIAKDDVNCSENEIYTGKLFQLDIKMSFRGVYEYRFCVGDKNSYLVSTYVEYLPQNLPDLTHKSTVKLTPQVTNDLKAKYQKTVTSLSEENSRGKDGSTWCFHPKSGMSYSRFCYWSPEANTSERGLTELDQLKTYIHKLSGLK
ncbi:MAG: hypothetical protein HRT53_16480 [Colwellia sp.]|nr:hypothetical protein [Colwellia sp.]